MKQETLRRKEDVVELFPTIMKLVRKYSGLSQDQVAGSIGITKQMVWKWEQGKALPSKEHLKKWIILVDSELKTYWTLADTMQKAINAFEKVRKETR